MGVGHHYLRIVQKWSANQGLIFLWVHPYNQIISLLDHLYFTVIGHDFKLYSGIVEYKFGCELAHGGLGKQQRNADPQTASRYFPSRRYRYCRFLKFSKQLTRTFKQRQPFFRQPEIT